MARKPAAYTNESITSLKGADRVRKRPGVIFGSDGLEGCEHAVFEILSNSIDEAREGFGNIITVTLYDDKSIEIEDFGRGCPVDWNPAEKRFNWELVYCELYAGGKYKNDDGGDYEYSLGLNGLGACATQYASEYMDVTVWRDGNKYTLHFAKGKIKGKMLVEPSDRKKTGTTTRWKPDIEVFTDINIPVDYYLDTLKRQAVVNSHIKFVLKNQVSGSKFDTTEFLYQNGIVDYVGELAGEILIGESSELYQKLYDENVIDADFSVDYERMKGMALLELCGDSEQPERILQEVLQEAACVIKTGVDRALLDRLKKSVTGRRLRGLDGFEGTCYRMCAYYFDGAEYLDYPDIYAGVTAEDVEQFIRENVKEELAFVSVIRPKREKEEKSCC